jgi:hypothetical protein
MNRRLNLAETVFVALEQVTHLRAAPGANDTGQLLC